MPVDAIERLGYRGKQSIAIALDCVMLPLALACALVLRHGRWDLDWLQFWPAFAVTLGCVPLFVHSGLYRHILRYVGSQALVALVRGVTITAVALLAIAFAVRLQDFPRSVPVIFWLLAFVYVAGTRYLVRFYAEAMARNHAAKQPVAIYGAGRAGAYLAYQLEQDSEFRPVAILDDDRSKHGNVIQGLRVHPVSALPQLIGEHIIQQVLVAEPVETASARRRIVEKLEPYPVHVRVIPKTDSIVADSGPGAHIREIDVTDLLGRDEATPNAELLRKAVTNRVVLVTGAGGSIGSELARQIMDWDPHLLVLIEQSEHALYRIRNELELRQSRPHQIAPVLGSVLDRPLMERTMRSYHVDIVYHAAAYKHVDLVENNVSQGIRNNTFGTLRAAEAAIATGVSDFILISTDKAVRTRNVMGASKRLAEMALHAMQEQAPGTRLAVVRFGNVLVSSGSVVPRFLEQIDAGGPVTVTHKDATRYFMTISEAAQLVLQAASLAQGGDVFLLDMGQPVSILELARKTIRLKGHTVRDEAHPHGDIAIEFIGLRPGEKLHEELLADDCRFGTDHPQIMRAVESHVPWPELEPALKNLEKACALFDLDAIKSFMEGLLEGADLAEQLRHLPALGNVLPLPSGSEGHGSGAPRRSDA